ncbi:ribonuclease H-like domain-containing protein [Tanacetum coccineum]
MLSYKVDLPETVYMHQPPGFRDSVHPDYGTNTAYLLLYVDDIVLTASSESLLQQIISSLHQEFAMTDLEAEYRGVANAVVEMCWLRNLLRELHTPLTSATLVYYANVRVLHVASQYQFVDIFTKGLPSTLFEEFRSSLSVRCPPAPTAGEC